MSDLNLKNLNAAKLNDGEFQALNAYLAGRANSMDLEALEQAAERQKITFEGAK